MCGYRWLYHYNNERFWKSMLLALAGLLLLQYTISMAVVTRRSRLRYPGDPREDCASCEGRQARGVGEVVWSLLEGFLQWLGLMLPPPPPLPPCPAVPPNLTGPIPVTFQRPTFAEIESVHPELPLGGHWSPTDCKPATKVAIIVPYRDREEHLRIWINNIHDFLQKQQLDYGIFIIEQDPNSTFNRGLLMNIGFLEAQKLANYTCFIFHDVDLIPEDDRNLYTCSSQPRHMSASVDSMAYRLPYDTLFGGVEAFHRDQFQKVNGFSNKFFGWGAEDDDLYNRLQHHGINITRYPMRISRYRMIRHLKRDPSPHRFLYLNSGSRRYRTDGLNSVLYKRLQLDRRKLFTLISVEINQTEILNQGSEDERDFEFEMFTEIKQKMENEKKENVEKIIAKIRTLYSSKLSVSSVDKLSESASILLNKAGDDGYGGAQNVVSGGRAEQDEPSDRGGSKYARENGMLVFPINPTSHPAERVGVVKNAADKEKFSGANKFESSSNRQGEEIKVLSKEDRRSNIQRRVDEQLLSRLTSHRVHNSSVASFQGTALPDVLVSVQGAINLNHDAGDDAGNDDSLVSPRRISPGVTGYESRVRSKNTRHVSHVISVAGYNVKPKAVPAIGRVLEHRKAKKGKQRTV